MHFQVYYLTAYFVEPSTICTTGRTEADYESQGTGYMIALQNGPTPSDIEVIPLTMEEAQENVSQQFQHDIFSLNDIFYCYL